MPSNAVVWKPRFLGAISRVLVQLFWWYLQKKPLVPNSHAGFTLLRCGGIRGCGILLTDTEIRKSKPTDKGYRLPDGKGLFLFITPTGGKLWRFKYRHDAKQKLMALGQYPDVPLALARDRRAAARALLATGVDPMQVRKTEKLARKATSENSFQSIASLWLEHWRPGKSGQHVDATRRRIEANVFPLLGARPITEIEAPELVTMVKSIEGRGVSDLAKEGPGNDRADI